MQGRELMVVTAVAGRQAGRWRRCCWGRATSRGTESHRNSSRSSSSSGEVAVIVVVAVDPWGIQYIWPERVSGGGDG